jgi:hypothetical protein
VEEVVAGQTHLHAARMDTRPALQQEEHRIPVLAVVVVDHKQPVAAVVVQNQEVQAEALVEVRILVKEAERRIHHQAEVRILVKAAERHTHHLAEVQIQAQEVVERHILLRLAADQIQEQEAVERHILLRLAADQMQGAVEARQTLADLLVEDQIHHLAEVQIRHLVEDQIHHLVEDQIHHLVEDQIHHLVEIQIHHLVGQTLAAQAEGQTPAVPVVCQMPEAVEGLQIQEVPPVRQEERHKSHRTCRRASPVRRNEGSSWSPSRVGGPNRRPHRRQHTVVSTPWIKIEVVVHSSMTKPTGQRRSRKHGFVSKYAPIGRNRRCRCVRKAQSTSLRCR